MVSPCNRSRIKATLIGVPDATDLMEFSNLVKISIFSLGPVRGRITTEYMYTVQLSDDEFIISDGIGYYDAIIRQPNG